MDEIWRDIKGYEGIYTISNTGRLRSLDKKVGCAYGATRTFPGRIIELYTKDRYARARLADYKGNSKLMYIHRLVAKAFIDNPHDLPEVNHIDENKLNNNVNNLEWCDREYNNSYGTRLERQLKNHDYKKSAIKISETKRTVKYSGIYQMDLEGNIIAKWKTIKEAVKYISASYYGISACCRGKARTTGGYTWRYADEHRILHS